MMHGHLTRAARAALLLVAATAVLAIPASAANGYPAADSGYHDYQEMVADIRAVQAAHPAIVRVFSIGKSYQGRHIWAVEVSDHVGQDEGEPEVMFDALHHAREHLTPEMALYTLHLLADRYGQDTILGRRVTGLVDERRIWIIPMVNPDGLQYDLGGGPFGDGAYKGWRKNRQPTPGSTAVGTDLNRNYGYDWQAVDSPFAMNYPGPSAWSAPETRAVRDFVLSRRRGHAQRIRAYITFHTTGQLVMWPYSRDNTDLPPDMTALDHDALVAMGRAMAATNGYRALQSGDLAKKPGTAIDWMYGSQRVFAFTFELYPTSSGKAADFYPPDEVIERETKRNRDAVLYLIDIADCPYRALGKEAGYCGPMYDDLEVDRGWKVDPDGTDTATAGTWRRGAPAVSKRQLATPWSGRAVLVTGRASGDDVDGGRTTIRSPFVHLPAGQAATLRLRYWAGMSSAADGADRFRVEVVGRGASPVSFTALEVRGDGSPQPPAWRALRVVLPEALRGTDVAVLLTAVDGGADGVIEAGVDDVRITLSAP
jgi:carboxypeptidase T